MIRNDYNVDDTYQEFTYIQFLVYMYLITRPYCTKLEKIITIFKLDAQAVLLLKNCYTPIFILVSFFFKYKNNFAALKGRVAEGGITKTILILFKIDASLLNYF